MGGSGICRRPVQWPIRKAGVPRGLWAGRGSQPSRHARYTSRWQSPRRARSAGRCCSHSVMPCFPHTFGHCFGVLQWTPVRLATCNMASTPTTRCFGVSTISRVRPHSSYRAQRSRCAPLPPHRMLPLLLQPLPAPSAGAPPVPHPHPHPQSLPRKRFLSGMRSAALAQLSNNRETPAPHRHQPTRQCPFAVVANVRMRVRSTMY